MTGPSRTGEFLALFNEIEQHLRSSLGRTQHDSFAELVRGYREKRHVAPVVLRDLRTFADLRNLLSHQPYHGDRPIAEPTPEVLDRTREVHELLLRPPTVLSVLGARTVVTVQAGDPVRTVLHHVRTLDYSQFPVYDADGWAGLLTTNAIARWFARQMDDDEVVTGDEPVSAALRCAEEQDSARHVPRTASAAEAIALLGRPLPSGSRPRALVVTTNGRPAETPLAVVVDEDLPQLHRALDVPGSG